MEITSTFPTSGVSELWIRARGPVLNYPFVKEAELWLVNFGSLLKENFENDNAGMIPITEKFSISRPAFPSNGLSLQSLYLYIPCQT